MITFVFTDVIDERIAVPLIRFAFSLSSHQNRICVAVPPRRS